jgi:hypothetical protein
MKDKRTIDPKASKLRRQEPGKMGLGASEQEMRPPAGWTPPKKPDLMTTNTKPRRGGRT